MAWIARLRLRMLAWVAAIGLATVATVSFVGLPWIPIVGFAVAFVVGVNKSTRPLERVTCLQCGLDLTEQPIGQYGVACPDCGAISQPLVLTPVDQPAARTDTDQA